MLSPSGAGPQLLSCLFNTFAAKYLETMLIDQNHIHEQIIHK